VVAAAEELIALASELEDEELTLDPVEGRGVLTVEGEEFPVTEGDSIFVPAGALHQFTGARSRLPPRRARSHARFHISNH